MSGHWKFLKQLDEKGKLQLAKFLLYVCREILWDKHPETKAPYSYNPDINTKKELKALVKPAVEKVAKKSGWAQKFLSDRLNTQITEDLTFEIVSGSVDSGEEVTQKQVRDQIKKATETFVTPEGQKARVEQKSKKTTPSSEAKQFSTTTDYQLIPPSQKDLNAMSEEEKNAYEALYDEATGRELRDAVKSTGYQVSGIESLLQKFINKGILTPKEEESGEKDFEEGDTGEVTSGVDVDELTDIAGSFDDTINSFKGRNWDE
jgi:hypothetical protein